MAGAIMKAVVCNESGPPSVLHLQHDFPRPVVEPGKVLLRVQAFSMERMDIMIRQGIAPRPPSRPKVLGSGCIGIVEDVSDELKRHDEAEDEENIGARGAKYRKGDIVAVVMGGREAEFNGCYAEYTLLPPSCLSSPLNSLVDSSQLSFSNLAAIPSAFLTAYNILTWSLHIIPEDTLMVHGGSTAIGMATGMLAKNLLGVKKVVGTTRSWSKMNKMRKAGFDHVIVVPPSEVSSPPDPLVTYLKAEAKEMEGLTAQLVLLGSTHIPVALACAKTPGRSRVCMAGMLAGQYFMVDKFSPMAIPIGVSISGYSSSFIDHMAPLRMLVQAVIDGKIETNLDKVFSMADIIQAHEYSDANLACGKVVCLIE